jgi:hypothetical protein
MDQFGLHGSLGAARFTAEAFRIACDRVGRDLVRTQTLAQVDILIDWGTADGELRYPTHAGGLAHALLLPWTKTSVSEDIQKRVQNFLVERYGDPRLQAKRWNMVNDDAKRVIFSWLAKDSLNQFLDVVGTTAKAHQWEYRRAFWMAYFKAGHISESWVVFARNPAANARRLAAQMDNPSMRSFGEFQQSSGATADQAVLLLKIGALTVADWSHDGACRIWKGSNQAVPELYWHGRKGYVKHGLTDGCDFQKTHWPQGNWQAEAAKFIGKHTDVWLAERDYMPPGWRR